MAQIVLADVQAYDPAIYGVRTLRFATQPFVTGSAPIADPTPDSRIVVTRAGTATRVNSQGRIETVAANTLRYDYNPTTRAIRGSLVEESRQNVLTYSEQCWNTSFWGVGTTLANFYTVTSSTEIADIYGGTGNVAKFVAAASTAVLFLRKTLTLGAGTYAGSIFIYVPAQSGVNNWQLQMDAADVEASAASTASTTFGSWVRVQIPTLTTAASRTFWDFNILVNGAQPPTGFTFYAMGAQLEAGAFHTSYIPTVAAAVTRNSDINLVTGTNFSAWYNASEGTFFAEGEWGATSGSGATRLFQADDGTENDRILLIATNTGSRAILSDNGPNARDVTLSASGTVRRAAIAYKANDVQSAESGVVGTATTSATMPTVNTLRLGSIVAGTLGQVWIRRLYYWPTRLSDAQLAALTAGQSIPAGARLMLDFMDGADTVYEGRIQQPANVKRSCFGDGQTFGRTQIGYGDMVLVNNDGALDGLLDYSFAGRPIHIRLGTINPNMTAPTWTTVLRGVMEQAQLSWQKITVRVRDRQQDLAQPLQQIRYTGGGTSLEGGADLEGKPKPIVYGKVYNIAPPQTDTTRRIYQLHSGSQVVSVDAVYDRGSTLTAGAAYTTQTDMENNAPAAGQYRVWNDATNGCYIRLGSAPNGTLTADVTANATRTVGQLFNAILLKAGVSSADISSADITAIDAAVNYEVGVYSRWDRDITSLELLDELCASVGAYYGSDTTGVFRIGRIVLPTGADVGTITATDIIKIERVASRDRGVGIPAFKVKVGYQKVQTVQSDLGSGVAETRKVFVASEYRRTEATDAAVKTANLTSPELTFNTVLTSKTNAGNEAERLLTIYKSRRDTYDVTVRVDAALASVLDLGKIVTLQINRFGMSAGKKFLIIGIRTNMQGYQYDLTLWG